MLRACPLRKAFAEADEEQEGKYTPGNAKHGQKRAQLVGPQGGQGLADDLEKSMHRAGVFLVVLHTCRRAQRLGGSDPDGRSRFPP